MRVEKLLFLDNPNEGEDTIPLVRVEKLFFWFGSHGHVGSLGYRGRTYLERGTCYGDMYRGVG